MLAWYLRDVEDKDERALHYANQLVNSEDMVAPAPQTGAYVFCFDCPASGDDKPSG